MPEYTIRNPHETVPLTAVTARALGVDAIADSSGQLAAIYELDDEAEAECCREMGFIVEAVPEDAQGGPSMARGAATRFARSQAELAFEMNRVVRAAEALGRAMKGMSGRIEVFVDEAAPATHQVYRPAIADEGAAPRTPHRICFGRPPRRSGR